MKFIIKKLKNNEDSIWDNLVNNSDQETVFADSEYLKNSGENFVRLVIYKGSELKAGIYFVLDNNLNIVNSELVIYCNILFKNNKNQKQVNLTREKFKITEVIVDFLVENYKNINLTLYDIVDLRPFIWKNYNNNLNKFSMILHYTSVLDISEFFLRKKDKDMKLFENLDDKRKNDIQKAMNAKYKLTSKDNTDDFIKVMKDMLNSKDVKVGKSFFNNTKFLLRKLLELDMCKIFSVEDNKNNVLYYCVFLFKNNKGYYLFGAGNRELMSRFAGTFCIWESMRQLSRIGISEINFEGVNSPNRGDFKLSFGGNLEQYFELVYKS